MLRFSLLISLLAAGPAFAQDAAAEKKLTPETFEASVEKTLKLNYLLSLPEGFDKADSSKKWPLLVFLHGAGERGDNLDQVKVHGPPKLVAAGKKFPFVVISPQCPKDSWWTAEPVMEMIDDAEKRYQIDPDRIYLTGLSMGGYGTWHFASNAPNRFAAVAPICGGGVPYFMRRLKHLPVWAFHGAKDSVVPLNESERLVESLTKGGNSNVKFTVYPEANHDSWTAAYDTPELYDWFLSHKRGGGKTKKK